MGNGLVRSLARSWADEKTVASGQWSEGVKKSTKACPPELVRSASDGPFAALSLTDSNFFTRSQFVIGFK